ncbi:MAG: glycosyltransferase family 39 protein [Paracoccaceae bacterium]
MTNEISNVGSGNRPLWMICLVASVIPLLLGAYTLFEPFGRDQGIHATIAAALQDGLATYREVYNIKPPMTTATHWLALEMFGHSIFSIRYLDMLMVMLGMACLSGSIVMLGGSSTLAIGSVTGFSSMFYSLTYWEHAQTDEWAAICVIICLLFLSLAWRFPDCQRRFLLVFFAGMMVGIGFNYKYTIAISGILIFVPVFVPGDGIKFYWRDLIWFVFGGLAFLTLVVSILAWTGTLMPFLEIQEFVMGYVGNTTNNVSVSLTGLTILSWFSKFNVWLVLLGLGVFAVNMYRQGISVLHVVTVMLIIAGWSSGYAQGKGFIYHFIPILTGYSILIGFGLEALFFSIRRRANATISGAVVLVALLFGVSAMTTIFNRNAITIGDVFRGTPLVDRLEKYGGRGDDNFSEILKFSDDLAKRRKPEDAIFVWGFETTLYFLQEYSPRYRYPYAWPFSVDFYDGRYSQDLLKRLEKKPPRFFIVQKKDATPWATGHQLDSRKVLELLPSIQNFLESNFELVFEADKFDLWEKTTG